MNNMHFEITYHPEVKKDIIKLKLNKKTQLELKDKIEKIAYNPYPKSIGGLGEPLKRELKHLLKFRFNKNYRVVYRLEVEANQMKILIIGIRRDANVYKVAEKRLK